MKLRNVRGGRLLPIFAAVAAMSAALPVVSQSSANDLNSCAAIQTQAERLACYDKLAGRQPQPTPPPAAAPVQPAPPPTAAQPTPSQPAAARKPAMPPAAPVSAAATAPAPGTPEAFGLYKAEHPAAPKSPVETIKGKVVDLKYDAYGKETISLEGGAMWQLAGSDAILAKGDEVTIKRAAFGSYLMTTTTGREHRVKRLR
jgi:hypothetical protein